MPYMIVGANIDTWIINVKGDLPAELGNELDRLKEVSQELEEDVTTPWTFAGETLFIRAHGSGRQWRWILHCPSLHLDVGRGRVNGIIGKARLASALLWEHSPDVALGELYEFLADFYGEGFSLQVSEAHLCADIAGWEPLLDDAPAFITRGHRRKTRLAGESEDMADEPAKGGDPEAAFVGAAPEINLHGRRCTGFEFSRGAVHSCCVYDKTKEIAVSRKDWMRAVWERNGWDGASRVVRVEFRYKRECLKELGIECPHEMLDQLAGMWAYSTMLWLRHTWPSADTNRGRWPTSPFWQAVQAANFLGDSTPLVREKRHAGDLRLICQMLAGCSTTAAAFLAGQLPQRDDGTHFLIWFSNWLERYLAEKRASFEAIRDHKQLRLGIVVPGQAA
jgi:hypothetical protein